VALRAAVVAAVLRAGAVFLLASHVAASTLRETADKGLELFLALPYSRSSQYLGRLAGHAAAAFLIAALFTVPLFLSAPAARVAMWGASLALEAALVAAIALFFAMSLSQVVPAIAATLGLYLLARVMPAAQLIAAGPLSDTSMSGTAARWLLDAIALVLPPFDEMTRTDWLLYGLPDAQAMAALFGAFAIYAALAVSAGLFDFYRRNL
jgi:hypothetical protein